MRNALEEFIIEEEEMGEEEAEQVPESKAVVKNQVMESFFVPRPLFVASGEAAMRPVARYGRIYKRKAPNYSKSEHGKIVCPPGAKMADLE